MKTIVSVKEGMDLVDLFTGSPREFELAVPDVLLDPVGISMALITDRVLRRGWQPNGFIQHEGFRLYSYKELE
jgi:hypothetical protein